MREALKLALEALEALEAARNGSQRNPIEPAITTIKAALAQPVQEPVALTGKQRTLLAQAWAMLEDYAQDQLSYGNDIFANGAEASAHEIKKMLTTPPAAQRQWVGLTDDEIEECWDGYLSDYQLQMIRELEAKLKEKNT